MPIDPELLELMGEEVVWQAAETIDGYGKRGYSGGTPLRCHTSGKSVDITGPDGTVTTAAGTIWLDDHYPDITLSDRVVLAQYGTRGIVEVTTVYDEDGPNHTKLLYGAQ